MYSPEGESNGLSHVQEAFVEEIEGKRIYYSYDFSGSENAVLKDVAVKIRKGGFTAILGHNGCGKSTLVRHFNALLPLQQGELSIAGIDVKEEERIWELRRRCGLVFQNPDNQFVSTVVEEDIAFGLENYDTQEEEIEERVKEALAVTGMEGFEKRAPHTLSGGQKQRVALAGVLAVEPDIIVFDEAVAMLDPKGREEVLDNMQKLHRLGKTIVMITHYVEEALLAEQIYLMKEGEILAEGTPREILTKKELLGQAGLEPPLPVRMYYDLLDSGICLSRCPLTREELVEELCQFK